jgi:hypothetical protein
MFPRPTVNVTFDGGPPCASADMVTAMRKVAAVAA